MGETGGTGQRSSCRLAAQPAAPQPTPEPPLPLQAARPRTQVGGQALLRELQLLQQVRQHGAQQLRAHARVHHVERLARVRHHLGAGRGGGAGRGEGGGGAVSAVKAGVAAAAQLGQQTSTDRPASPAAAPLPQPPAPRLHEALVDVGKALGLRGQLHRVGYWAGRQVEGAGRRVSLEGAAGHPQVRRCGCRGRRLPGSQHPPASRCRRR